MNSNTKRAFLEAIESLKKLPPEKFSQMLASHHPGDVANLLEASGAFSAYETELSFAALADPSTRYSGLVEMPAFTSMTGTIGTVQFDGSHLMESGAILGHAAMIQTDHSYAIVVGESFSNLVSPPQYALPVEQFIVTTGVGAQAKEFEVDSDDTERDIAA